MKRTHTTTHAFFLSAATFATVLMFSVSADAATRYWDGNDTTVDADGGTGTWDTTATNWDDAATGGANATWNNATPDDATFGGTAGTVTLGTNISVDNMTFNTDGYTIDLGGNTLTNSVNGNFITGGAGTVTATIQNGTVDLSQPDGVANFTGGSDTFTFASNVLVTGSNGILNNAGGFGIVLQNDSNDFTGDLEANFSGNFDVTSIADSGVASAAGAGSVVNLGNNSSLIYRGGSDSTDRTLRLEAGATSAINLASGSSLTWNGVVDNQASTKTFNSAGNTNTTFTLTTALADNGANVLSFRFSGGGVNNRTILEGQNTFTGDINGANQARLIIDGAGTLGWNGSEGVYAGNIDLNQASDFEYSSTATQTISGIIDDDASDGEGQRNDVIMSGSGTLTLTGNNTYEGNTIVNAGTLLINGDNSAADNTYTVSGGTLGGTGTIGGDTTIASGAFLSAGDGGVGTLNFSMTVDISGAVGGPTGSMLFDLQGASTDVVSVGADGTDILTIGTGELNFDDFTFTSLGGFVGGTYTIFDTNNSIDGTLGSSLDGFINGLAASISLSGDGQDILLTVVPEPSSSALLGLGGLALMLRRKRR